MTEEATILHTCSEPLIKQCKAANKAGEQANEILGLLNELAQGIKNHLNNIHHECFQKACEEYPPLADGNNPCQLSFEHGYVYIPKGEENPAQAFQALMEQVAKGAGGAVLAAGTPEDLMEKLRTLVSGDEEEEAPEPKKVLN